MVGRLPCPPNSYHSPVARLTRDGPQSPNSKSGSWAPEKATEEKEAQALGKAIAFTRKSPAVRGTWLNVTLRLPSRHEFETRGLGGTVA
jgi:hypothetical protein